MIKHLFYILLTVILLSSCKQDYDNFTTYFNTYYNADKLMRVSEEEFAFQLDKRKFEPRVFAVQTDIWKPTQKSVGVPEFMQDFIIKASVRQPVAIKLDSILIKGSKIMAKAPRSDYIEKTLFLMAKTYFYREEWLPAEIKCSELVDRYPDGDLSPDAHLLYSKALLIERKFYEGTVMLSRTVDIAWHKKRFDILSEAFKLQAEQALYENKIEEALRPYRQAIAQTDDPALTAQWQIDLAALLFRLGMFEKAYDEFALALEYKTTYLEEFEARLYMASCKNRLQEFEEADKILLKLEEDSKFEEWKPFCFAERMNQMRVKGDSLAMQDAEAFADTAFVNNKLISIYYFEKANDFYVNSQYANAYKYFGKAKLLKTPVLYTAMEMNDLLGQWTRKNVATSAYYAKIEKGEELGSEDNKKFAKDLFELGRIQDIMGKRDSAIYYYGDAVRFSPKSDTTTARYLFAYSNVVFDQDPYLSDSLSEQIIYDYPNTEYGVEKRRQFGFTDAFVIDTAAEYFNSGVDMRRTANYDFAIKQFLRVYQYKKNSKYSPRALYNVGYTYEHNLNDIDSALKYYEMLRLNYPKSDYAKDVTYAIDYLLTTRAGEEPHDTLKYASGKPNPFKGQPLNTAMPADLNMTIDPNKQAPVVDPTQNPNKSGGGLFDMIKDPSKLLDAAKDAISNPINKGLDEFNKTVEEVENFEMPSPEDMMKNPFGTADSTKSITPPDSLQKK